MRSYPKFNPDYKKEIMAKRNSFEPGEDLSSIFGGSPSIYQSMSKLTTDAIKNKYNLLRQQYGRELTQSEKSSILSDQRVWAMQALSQNNLMQSDKNVDQLYMVKKNEKDIKNANGLLSLINNLGSNQPPMPPGWG